MKTELNRIAKTIAASGIASRREAERMIEAGQVRVNGIVITSPALNVSPRDLITVNGRRVEPATELSLFIYHKPTGQVVSHSDPEGRKTVFDALPKEYGRLVSIGRLDLNSEGLLLLTNSGEFQRFMESPSNELERIYSVRTHGVPNKGDMEKLRKGITVDGIKYAPITLRVDDKTAGNAWSTVILHEGKNREIRKTLNSLGMEVSRLIRISYAGIKLGNLKPGEIRQISVPSDLLSKFNS
ncbi:MAG: rRNA pseudouridine synthase [Rickettsiales bacterium]|jgi:23S rRNA pseudouridine2605 synthase|nr:rRNA pseudouridine synthase [Rickettsiales bacterium]